MLPEHDPGAASGIFDSLLYVGGAIGAIVLGVYGYLKSPRKGTLPTTSIAGAIVDNSAIQPLLSRFDALISRLDKLIEALSQDVQLRELAHEKEEQQEMIDRAIQKMTRTMRDSAPAPMPKIRRGEGD